MVLKVMVFWFNYNVYTKVWGMQKFTCPLILLYIGDILMDVLDRTMNPKYSCRGSKSASIN